MKVEFAATKTIALAQRLLLRLRLRRMGVEAALATPSYTHPDELIRLYALTRNLPEEAHVLEIGSHLGVSACVIGAALAISGGHLWCVDTWDNAGMPDAPSNTMVAFETLTAPLRGTITAVRKDSRNLVQDDVGGPLDLVFIDGDHSYEVVRDDLQKALGWVLENGLVVLHDSTTKEGVSRAIGEALAANRCRIRGNFRSLTWLGTVLA